MRKFIAVALLAVSLSGCATFQNAYNAATGSSVPGNLVIVAVNSFDAVEATATNYLRLPKCIAGGTPFCRSVTATAKLVPAIRAGRVARNNLEAFMQANPGALGPAGLYNALISATTTLQGVVNTYNVGVS